MLVVISRAIPLECPRSASVIRKNSHTGTHNGKSSANRAIHSIFGGNKPLLSFVTNLNTLFRLLRVAALVFIFFIMSFVNLEV
jgi:hypothetical protein